MGGARGECLESDVAHLWSNVIVVERKMRFRLLSILVSCSLACLCIIANLSYLQALVIGFLVGYVDALLINVRLTNEIVKDVELDREKDFAVIPRSVAIILSILTMVVVTYGIYRCINIFEIEAIGPWSRVAVCLIAKEFAWLTRLAYLVGKKG
jgi:hypothetical protein